jgi:hypothetical protein
MFSFLCIESVCFSHLFLHIYHIMPCVYDLFLYILPWVGVSHTFLSLVIHFLYTPLCFSSLSIYNAMPLCLSSLSLSLSLSLSFLFYFLCVRPLCFSSLSFSTSYHASVFVFSFFFSFCSFVFSFLCLWVSHLFFRYFISCLFVSPLFLSLMFCVISLFLLTFFISYHAPILCSLSIFCV